MLMQSTSDFEFQDDSNWANESFWTNDLVEDEDENLDEADSLLAAFDSTSDIGTVGEEHAGPSNIEENSTSEQEPIAQDSITQLETLALSFLSQLSLSFPGSNNMEEDGGGDNTAKPSISTKEVILPITDRRRKQPSQHTLPKSTRYIRFPRKVSAISKEPSSRNFATLFRIMQLSHEALIYDTPVTKRDIFYKDVPLFKKQSIVDNLVDDLAATFNIPRCDLNIRASSKGLFCGSILNLHLRQGGTVSGNDKEATLIPPGESISNIVIQDDISWVLIIEKEAIFQTLCFQGLVRHPALPGPGLLITGKGYPDRATRELVNKLNNCLPDSVPILALVDADPFGIDILSVYKFGSDAMRHESEHLVSPRIQWIGVFGTELNELGIDKTTLIPMTSRDHKKALSMLRRPTTVMPLQFRRELTHILHMRYKAEIEIISSRPRDGLNFSSNSHHFSAHNQPTNNDKINLSASISKGSLLSPPAAVDPMELDLSIHLDDDDDNDSLSLAAEGSYGDMLFDFDIIDGENILLPGNKAGDSELALIRYLVAKIQRWTTYPPQSLVWPGSYE